MTPTLAFGAARAKPAESDGRNWSRFPCEVKAVYQIIPAEDGVRREAKVLNISAGGVAMLVDHDVRNVLGVGESIEHLLELGTVGGSCGLAAVDVLPSQEPSLVRDESPTHFELSIE